MLRAICRRLLAIRLCVHELKILNDIKSTVEPLLVAEHSCMHSQLCNKLLWNCSYSWDSATVQQPLHCVFNATMVQTDACILSDGSYVRKHR